MANPRTEMMFSAVNLVVLPSLHANPPFSYVNAGFELANVPPIPNP